MAKWQTLNDLKDLLSLLVEHPSITGTKDEVAIAEYIHLQLSNLSYFQENEEHIQLHPISDGRQFLTALVKKPNAKKTVILLSHFDVVDVEDYGGWKNLAFRPFDLTNEFQKHHAEMPETVSADLQRKDEDWYFGRGTMDMKAGIALHMSMLEKASNGDFDGNVLMLTVPDEEANSAGMIGAVPILVELAKKFQLSYTACLNSEPMFSKYPGDKNHYVYTGSIGKVLPGFFCYGKETHVGEPFAGLNANYMASELSRALELNTDFCETVNGVTTPPPTNLMQRDLKEEYSVQIPHSAVTVFNVLTMKKSMDTITNDLLLVAKNVATTIEDNFMKRANYFSTLESFSPKKFKVRVFTYEQLLQQAIERFGIAEIERRQNYLTASRYDTGDREFSTRLVQDLAALCKDLGPMIVLYYSPPFYPAVSSREEPLVKNVLSDLQSYANQTYNLSLHEQEYFPGLSDLSFVSLQESSSSLGPLTKNMPIFGKGYELPVEELKSLNIPVLNLGPRGRDAHQWTERLELKFSFLTLHDLLPYTINKLLS